MRTENPSERHWRTPIEYETHARTVQHRNAVLVAALHPAPSEISRAFEIGCGTGALTSILVRTLPPSAEIDALDISTEMLATAAARDLPPRVRLQQGEFLAHEYTGGYDGIFSNALMHWLYPRYQEFLHRIRGMLIPGGFLCAATAGRSPDADAFDGRMASALADSAPPDTPAFADRRLSLADVTELAAQAHLEILDLFLVERHTTMTAAGYAAWVRASCGTAPGNDASVDATTRALGGTRAHLDVVHASVMFALRRPYQDG